MELEFYFAALTMLWLSMKSVRTAASSRIISVIKHSYKKSKTKKVTSRRQEGEATLDENCEIL